MTNRVNKEYTNTINYNQIVSTKFPHNKQNRKSKYQTK